MTKAVGDRGEILVANLLKANGWQILETQWRCRWGEVDLIVCDRQWLLFIEVKTRNNHNWDSDGRLAITAKKQAKLIKAASIFLSNHPHLAELACRFDVALVRWRKHNHETPNETVLDISQFYLQEYIEQAFVP
ncbi:YraN family protein [Pseudanabaena biceps]|nr:YraN family protein [Pseudanabaena biceps]